jgi:hypothetical protein
VIPATVGAAAGLAAAFAVGALVVRHAPSALVRENHAGHRVPAVLGAGLLAGFAIGPAAGAVLFEPPRAGAGGLFAQGLIWSVAAALAVVGLVDDLSPGGPRGMRDHLRTLVRARPSTGVLKLAMGVIAATVTAFLLGGGAVRIALAIVLIAAATNVWNTLDVAPGRALKWAVVAAALWGTPAAPLMAGLAGSAAGLLPADLRERGMLGDAGSNPLGFAVGVGLALVLPTPWLAVAAVGAVALQVAAETVTISRLIEAVPPVRWFDRLGRRRPA